jgi:putative flippase GtrA
VSSDAESSAEPGDGGPSRVDALRSRERVGKFVSVGAVGFAADLSVSTLLNEWGVLPAPELAVAVGIEVAIVVMFVLNDRWTFPEAGRDARGPILRRLARSHIVRVGGIATQLAVFALVYRGLPVDLSVAGVDAWFVVGKTSGVAAGMIVNYVAESLFTWRIAGGDRGA